MTGPWGFVKYGCCCLWVMVAALGCAEVSRHAGPRAGEGVPKQLQGHQVIVTLPSVSPEQQADFVQRITQEYNLLQTGAFPLNSLGLQCLVLRVPGEQDINEVMARLAADPHIESVQLNQVFPRAGRDV